MSHFAKIENDIVVEVIVAEQDFIDTLDGEWIQTSYNTYNNQHTLGGTPLRGNFASIGFVYDRTNDVFYPQKPYNSWTLDTSTWNWVSPIPMPSDFETVRYEWDEDTQSWVGAQR